ncbi:glycosyltransferase [Candidatus Woesebacteria bacterium]|nr:glycosyltransferase [Candidatus Woesebacteria bacterium]MCD8545931.1 glycosyltransferase [Candidatus Woesebacteria bacterium]
MKHPGSDPALSVVIPTFNGRHLLQKHLPDVVAMLRDGDEIVIVDDASTDDTAHWVKSFSPEKKIKIKYEKHKKKRSLCRRCKHWCAGSQTSVCISHQ